jgi:hypothetical protein
MVARIRAAAILALTAADFHQRSSHGGDAT